MIKWWKLIMLLALVTATSGCGVSNETKAGSLKIGKDVEYGDKDYELISDSNNQLGFNLMKDISKTEEGNVFLSPLSLFMALSVVYNGADGVTKAEIGQVLKSEGISPENLNQANASLAMQLFNRPEEIELNIANSIWVKDSYRFLDSFSNRSKDYYNAKIEEIDVMDPASADMINDWVSDATNGKIKDMVPKLLNSNMAAILLNAIYFKGKWQFPFAEKLTEERPFTLTDGTSEMVPLMNFQGKLPYLESENFQAVSLPYGEGEMSMNVFLPNANFSVGELANTMNQEKWTEWMAGFQPKEGSLMLPKFKMEYEVILNDTLARLGMETAFQSADLSKMFETGNGFYISEVKQKTFIDVNEQGTEAAAATSVSVEESAPADPFDMNVNRPFLFTITDTETGVVLFIGVIENPTA